ncbi:MAG TPA: class I SAM-dependent methyltransferase [Terracidiphilus sp.]|jgi:SAM-dependent methyltransferase
MNSTAIQLQECAQTKPANFDPLARIYRWLEWFTFGPVLWRCRCAFLDSMQDRRSALVIGDGDGRFTARLLENNSRVAIEALDVSEAMLRQLLRRAAPNIARVQTRVADARMPISFTQGFDLVVTHFFLDCLTTAEVESLAWDVREKLAPGARWVISEFAIPENLYGRLFALPLVSALYAAFGLLTGLKVRRLPRYRDALQDAGFVLMQERGRLRGLLVSEIWQADSSDPDLHLRR